MLGGLAVSLLAEVIGERRCLLAGLVMVSAGSACGAVAGSVTALLTSRAIEGAGCILIVVGGIGAAGSIAAGALLQRGVAVRVLLIPSFAAMAVTSLLTFAVDWAAWPGGAIGQFACLIAFSFSGAAIPATLFRIAVDLAPPAGSTAAAIGLMQQIFNAGSVAGPAMVAWLVTATRSWQATSWMTCAFAALGGLLSGYLSERRLGIAFGPRTSARGTR